MVDAMDTLDSSPTPFRPRRPLPKTRLEQLKAEVPLSQRLLATKGAPPPPPNKPRLALQELSTNVPNTPSHSAPTIRRPPSTPDNTYFPVSASDSVVKRLRIAFSETPPELRQLEEGWWRTRTSAKLAAAAPILKSQPKPLPAQIKDDSPLQSRPQGDSACSRSPKLNAQPQAPVIPPTPLPPSKQESPPPLTASPPAARTERKAIRSVSFLPTPPASPRSAPTSAALQAPLPTSPESLPPHNLPEPCNDPPKSAPRPDSLVPHATPSTPSPIIARPLPPTSSPLPLDKQGVNTIAVHYPSDPFALTFALNRGQRVIQVNHAGDQLQIATRREAGAWKHGTLKLKSHTRWKGREMDFWHKLWCYVENTKMHTARAKLYTALGEIVVTCSEPPDIILQFTIAPEWKPTNGDNTLRITSETVAPGPGTPRMSYELRPSMKPISFEHPSQIPLPKINTKVRVRYSASSHELAIDTSFKNNRMFLQESRKTRRVVPLRLSHPIGERPFAEWVAALDEFKPAMQTEWTRIEREAVKRLWELRDDWSRYVPRSVPSGYYLSATTDIPA